MDIYSEQRLLIVKPFPAGQNFQFFPNQQNLNVVRGRIINVEFSLILKLALLVYVLAQGGSLSRMVILTCCAVAFYLYNGRARVRVVRMNANGQPIDDPPANQNPHQNDPTPPNQGQEQIPTFYRDQTIFGEVLKFVIPLFMSLLPRWRLPNLGQN